MPTRSLIRIAGIVGGLCWLAKAAFDGYDSADTVVDALYYGGGVLIAVSLVGLGSELVSAAPWLKVVVGLAFPVLVVAVLSVLHEQASDSLVDGGFGLVLALICSASLLGGVATDETSVRGSHAK